MGLNLKDMGSLEPFEAAQMFWSTCEGLSVLLRSPELCSSLPGSLNTPFQRNKMRQYPATMGAEGAYLPLSILLPYFIVFSALLIN